MTSPNTVNANALIDVIASRHNELVIWEMQALGNIEWHVRQGGKITDDEVRQLERIRDRLKGSQ